MASAESASAAAVLGVASAAEGGLLGVLLLEPPRTRKREILGCRWSCIASKAEHEALWRAKPVVA